MFSSSRQSGPGSHRLPPLRFLPKRLQEKDMPSPIMKYFTFEHLRDPGLKEVSRQCASLARAMEEELPDGPEKSAGLRHLLEAKDCFVRAKMD